MIEIKITSVQDPITIDTKKYLLVEAETLSKLLNENASLKAAAGEHMHEIEELKKVIYGTLAVLNLYDPKTNTVNESVLNGSESYIKPIMKAVAGIMGLLSMSAISASAKTELEEKFKFITLAFPMIKKYAGTK